MNIDPDLNLLLVCLGIAVLSSIWLIITTALRRHRRDPQRLFSWEQKKILLAQASHRCEHKPLLWKRCSATTGLQADHVMPWSRGGPTRLWNGAVLCPRHNRRKSNRIPTQIYIWRLEGRRRKY